MAALFPFDDSLFAPITGVWAPTYYADPMAPASSDAIYHGQQLASALLGTQVLYVYDHRAKQTSFVSQGVKQLLGYSAAEFTTDFHYARILPADQGLVIEATRLVNRYVVEHLGDPFPGLMFSIDYRLQHANGQWVHVLKQSFWLERESNGALVAAAGVLTDVTALIDTLIVQFHLNRPDFVAFVRQEQLHALPTNLTNRERVIATLMVEGLTKRQISEQVSLNLRAIDGHLRAIAHKMGLPQYYLLRHISEVGPESYLGSDHVALLGNKPAFAAFLSSQVPSP